MAATQITTYKNYIGGQWVESVTGKTYPVHNPARNGQVVGEFQTSGAEDALKAVAAAKEGLKIWADTPAPARAGIIFKAMEIMGRRAQEIAETITTEEGKPIGDALGEVRRAMNIMEYAAGEGRRMFGYTTPSELPNTVAYTIRRPIGVVGIITPWNFPIAIPAWKMAPALICGNALVFKPASATPLSAVKLTEIFEEAGLPPGVLNLVTGPGGQVGNALVESPDVKGISFTGSTEVGTDLYAESAKRLKKVQAELGGKNAVIVLSDADMDKALGGIVQGAFGSTGQRCTATSRVIVEEDVYDQFVSELVERTSKLTIGDGIDPSIDVSPLSSKNQKDQVLEYIGIGTEEGANLAFGGRALSGGDYDEGYYVEPTIFTGVSPEMRIAKEEIFGPVLTVFKAKDLPEAIDISNSVEFGLSSSVYTKDITKAYEYINTVETGMVHVNAPTLGGEVHLPFGGLGASGVGAREQGTSAVDFFTEVITVYIDHAAEATERAKFI
ncbi:MAG: aldehyde dehydrogenase family protein [SAR202 cluster bacterium]|nr:aldehyde dehydrogenase family protein [Chloroflexota bacterium]MBO20024.1 aldehyde dehydrogenase family protein [Chloroflexota bacterium]MQG34869.1 aldehyde dehydrogenase family protein [SAR202 cluster bacterium]HCL25220.1 aldehyde dehydrogenase family protein [Dehalococcoidia bacterium]HCP22613.1 aldehyde dehydrogenase family protein [Dehalococcoidia bacterium]|tara:strand:- start:5570 stop:7066 length:1497 start_codon:yes stop_codon:yes gene_type:complete